MIDITRWIDLESKEFLTIENAVTVKKMIKRGIELGAIVVDRNGFMKSGDNTIHVEIGTELVGVRYSAKACN